MFVEDVAFVIWKWDWLDEYDDDSSGTESRTSIEVISETPSPENSDEEISDEEFYDEEASASTVAIDVQSQVTHTITFKCMGSAKEDRYQESLKQISELRNNEVEVLCRIKPEPNNPYDSKAIAFECKIDGSWKVIGYIVREVLNEVHQALVAKKIVEVYIDWVKFKVWRSMGWYAGINITRVGQWSKTIVHCQSLK